MVEPQKPKFTIWHFVLCVLLGVFLFFGFEGLYLYLKGLQGGNGANFAHIITTLSTSDIVNAQVFWHVFLFGMPPLLFALYQRLNFYRFYRLDAFPTFGVVLLSILFAVCMYPMLVELEHLSKNIPLPQSLKSIADAQAMENEQAIKMFLHFDTGWDLAKMVLIMGVLAGFCEELFFRGAVQRILMMDLQRPMLAIVITGIFFGLAHMNLYQLLSISFIGMVFGVIYFRTGNLWITIIMHTVYNGGQVVLYYLYQKGFIPYNIDDNERFPLWVVLISCALCWAILRMIFKFNPLKFN